MWPRPTAIQIRAGAELVLHAAGLPTSSSGPSFTAPVRSISVQPLHLCPRRAHRRSIFVFPDSAKHSSRMAPTAEEVDRYLKNACVKDLRIQCRARGISPAGGKETLAATLKENMTTTNDYSIRAEDGTSSAIIGASTAGQTTADMAAGFAKNNYTRPDGQNVGNFLTDRNSSRVLAPPGGGSSIVFGDCSNTATPAQAAAAAAGSLADIGAGTPDRNANNYARPQGQNVGNFLTDRHAVKVHAPPGGSSQITFG